MDGKNCKEHDMGEPLARTGKTIIAWKEEAKMTCEI
jgi:hypothetical protein